MRGGCGAVTALTKDIRLLEIGIDKPMRFWAGQYVDLTIPGSGITRAFSMANAPGPETSLSFIIKLYPNGAFSARLDGGLEEGAELVAKGPMARVSTARTARGRCC